MPVQFIKLDDGAELAVLPREEYERLKAAGEEDAIDERAVKEARAAQAAGRLVAIPIEVADAIADGANPIKTLREWRGMTQLGLAEAAGLGQGYLSDLEKGRRQGAVATLGNLAQALGVSVDILVD